VEGVPPHGVHRHVVAVVGLEVLSGVVYGALVHLPLFGAHEEAAQNGRRKSANMAPFATHQELRKGPSLCMLTDSLEKG
jgi:hypothetical protein